MIWPLIQLLLFIALATMLFSFYNIIDDIGKTVLALISSVFWLFAGLAMFQIRFFGSGSINMLFYDFTLGSAFNPAEIVWAFYLLALIMGLVGIIRAIMLVFGGTIQGIEEVSGKRGSPFLTEMRID